MTVYVLLDLHLHLHDLARGYEAVHASARTTRSAPGNQAADVLVDVTDPAHVVVVEQWRSLDEVRAYRRSRQTPSGTERALESVLALPPLLSDFRLYPSL